VTDNFPYAEDGPDVWTWLQSWYVAQCNGDWEHSYGIAIDTLDNPGWSVTIDVARTALDPTTYSRREIHRSEDDFHRRDLRAHHLPTATEANSSPPAVFRRTAFIPTPTEA
jgi:hypothetical protein